MVSFYFYMLIVSWGGNININGADAGVGGPVQGTKTSRRRSCGIWMGTRALSLLGAALLFRWGRHRLVLLTCSGVPQNRQRGDRSRTASAFSASFSSGRSKTDGRRFALFQDIYGELYVLSLFRLREMLTRR